MHRTIIALLLCFPMLAYGAGNSPEGRWEGPIAIPGNEVQVVIDLARDGTGAWTGSIILQGLGVKGAPLANLAVDDGDIAFDVGDRFRSPTHGAMAFAAHLTAAGVMAGEMRQGGNVAKLDLKRTAPAQVEPAPRSTAVGRDLADRSAFPALCQVASDTLGRVVDAIADCRRAGLVRSAEPAAGLALTAG